MNEKDQESGLPSKIDGVMVGIVTNTKDPEKLARVKLKLPLLDATKETDWVRIATLSAGAQRGSLFIPKVGDEVLVAFHLGEIQKPYVIGCLWNKLQKGPPPDDENNIRGFKTSSGHELMFNDHAEQGMITIKSAKGRVIRMNEKEDSIKISQSDNNWIELKGGDSPKIQLTNGSNVITINSEGEITIKSKQSIKIQSNKLIFEADSGIDIISKGALNLKSSGTIVIEGSAVKFN